MHYIVIYFTLLWLFTTSQAQPCRVTTNWFGFIRLKKKTNVVVDSVDLTLPSYSYQSQAVWIQVPGSVKSAATKSAVEKKNLSFKSGLHAACHALLQVVPLFVRCNYSDLAPKCPNPLEQRYYPSRILLYGTGISVQV
ncbi:hypothetical protein ARALYDRAFT_904519 [Arabidopsis lyrata subsp. lyrata]|uniref:Uncharacterized protein n=1 Tax=Arabidopsis lyrata subsp. lyrata TaxID=81972 RepID=D7LQ76_ARALL|nr:hypothetical protein ARALYDRAFT_904519 [Arabidopsis lyrata subsp. lyrata]